MATRERMTTRPEAQLPDRGGIDPDHQLPPASGSTTPRGVVALIRDLADDTRTLVRQEIGLAKAEVGHTAKRFALDGAWIAAGVAVAAVGGICLVVAMALGLGVLLDSYWLGTLITGGTLVLVGALAAWKGARDLGKRQITPQRTMDSLREDADWARREMREFKDEMTRENT